MLISKYQVGQLHVLILEKWPYVGEILWIPEAYSPLVTRTACSLSVPYMGHMGPSPVDVLIGIAKTAFAGSRVSHMWYHPAGERLDPKAAG